MEPGHPVIHHWWNIIVFNIATEEHKEICTTKSGPDPNKPCIFPFKWKDAWHTYCINEVGGAWCSTSVDDSGNHIGRKNNWGHCGPECPGMDLYNKSRQIGNKIGRLRNNNPLFDSWLKIT